MTSAKKALGNLMASTWTKAALVRRAFKSGRPRKVDLRLHWKKALLQGLIAQEDIQNAMRDQELAAEDVRVSLVLISADLKSGARQAHVWRLPMTLEDVPPIAERIEFLELTERIEAPGLIFLQRDRELETQIPGRFNQEIWTERWLMGEDAQAAMTKAALEGVVSLDDDLSDPEGIAIPLV